VLGITPSIASLDEARPLSLLGTEPDVIAIEVFELEATRPPSSLEAAGMAVIEGIEAGLEAPRLLSPLVAGLVIVGRGWKVKGMLNLLPKPTTTQMTLWKPDEFRYVDGKLVCHCTDELRSRK
jgi:hypothetical protein